MTYYNDQLNKVKPLGGFLTIKIYGEGETNHLSLDKTQWRELKPIIARILNDKADKVNNEDKALFAKGER